MNLSLSIHLHGAKFYEHETATLESDPRLSVKNGPGRRDCDTSTTNVISGSQTGSESRMQVISRADFQPGLRSFPLWCGSTWLPT